MRPVECGDHTPGLSALLDQQLGAEERRALTAHLAGCGACRADLDRLHRTRTLMRSLPVREAPAGLFTPSSVNRRTPVTDAESIPLVGPPQVRARLTGRRARVLASVLALPFAALAMVMVLALLIGPTTSPSIRIDLPGQATQHARTVGGYGVPAPVVVLDGFAE